MLTARRAGLLEAFTKFLLALTATREKDTE
jgi:hypothetical protein